MLFSSSNCEVNDCLFVPMLNLFDLSCQISNRSVVFEQGYFLGLYAGASIPFRLFMNTDFRN